MPTPNLRNIPTTQQRLNPPPPYNVKPYGAPTREQVHRVHKIYCSMTGIDWPITAATEYDWYNLLKMVTEEDVKLYTQSRINSIKAGKATEHVLKPSYWMKWPEEVAETVLAIKAMMRKRKFPRDKASVLRASGRDGQPELPPAQSAAQVLEHKKMAEMIADWKQKSL